MAVREQVVEIEGKRLKLSNLEKVLYPEAGFTKAQVIDYYVRIAPALLPHLRGRPLTMKRYPNGVTGMHFYEKNCPAHRPEWVQTAPVWSEGNHRWMDYCLVQDLPTLVWAANLADLELHTSLSLARDIMRPTVIVFDLDPGAPANIVQCCQAALWVRGIFDALGLQSFPKTSGSKGLQVYVPLNTPVTYDDTKPFAHELARILEHAHRELIVSDMKKALRVNKVFVDWSQNDDHKTTICVYSLRARSRPTVSTPVTWDEVEETSKKGDPNLLVFDSEQVLARVAKFGDLFASVLTLEQTLPPLEALRETAARLGAGGRPLPAATPKPTKAAKARKTKAAEQRHPARRVG
ncbi:MAG: non-homologous end-joining DNA ligase [Terriglobales bacterium]